MTRFHILDQQQDGLLSLIEVGRLDRLPDLLRLEQPEILHMGRPGRRHAMPQGVPLRCWDNRAHDDSNSAITCSWS